MPPLGWRKAVDGAKGKSKQSANPPVYNNPPSVPERTGAALEALGGASFGTPQPTISEQGSVQSRRDEENLTMDVDDPSANSTPAPASVVPQGSSSDYASNTGMTPPRRSIKLKLTVKPTKADSPPPERPTPTRGRGRGGRARGARGGRGRGRGRKIVEVSPSASSGDESPVEEPAPLESEDDGSEMASDTGPPAKLGSETASEDEDDQEVDGDAEMDPDTTADMDEDLNELDGAGEIDPDQDDELDPLLLSRANNAKLTARQAALVAGGSTMDHVMLQAPSRKAQRTEAEIALRRSETARKRKHQDAQRLEDEKTETINRLLKKQSVKARNKKALDTPMEDAATDLVNFIPDNRPVVPCYHWVSSSKDATMTLSLSLPDMTNNPQLAAEANSLILPSQPVVRPPSTCAVSECTLPRKYRLSGAPDFETGACGIDHLKLLKTHTV